MSEFYFEANSVVYWGTRWRNRLRHYDTSRKVAGSIPDEVSEFFSWPNTSSRTMALGSTQPLTEMSTRNLLGGKADLTATCELTVWKVWDPRRLTTVWASTACYTASFTFLPLRYIYFLRSGAFHPLPLLHIVTVSLQAARALATSCYCVCYRLNCRMLRLMVFVLFRNAWWHITQYSANAKDREVFAYFACLLWNQYALPIH
jgi:hypothetical protein